MMGNNICNQRPNNNCLQTRNGKFHCTNQTDRCLGFKQADGMSTGNCEYFVWTDSLCLSKKARLDYVTVAIELGQKYLNEVKR